MISRKYGVARDIGKEKVISIILRPFGKDRSSRPSQPAPLPLLHITLLIVLRSPVDMDFRNSIFFSRISK